MCLKDDNHPTAPQQINKHCIGFVLFELCKMSRDRRMISLNKEKKLERKQGFE